MVSGLVKDETANSDMPKNTSHTWGVKQGAENEGAPGHTLCVSGGVLFFWSLFWAPRFGPCFRLEPYQDQSMLPKLIPCWHGDSSGAKYPWYP